MNPEHNNQTQWSAGYRLARSVLRNQFNQAQLVSLAQGLAVSASPWVLILYANTPEVVPGTYT